MLEIVVKGSEFFDEATGEFTSTKDQVLKLEHSLLSISKWESKWHKPFLGEEQKSNEEALDYVRCMTITQNVDPKVYLMLTRDDIAKIESYMSDQMTATWFSEKDNPKSKQKIVTSELVYYWMTALNIPFECEKWHFNRLLTLIRVCNIENTPKKKMSKNDTAKQYAMINAQRRKAMNTKG